MLSRLGPILFLACFLASAGCASICSTMLTRNESNSDWNAARHLRGVPITLKVPTHVKIYVYETYYLQKVPVGGITKTQRLPLPFAVRDFAQEFIYTEKIFTVDFKRPAAGTFNLRVDMTEDQYIQNLQHDVTDQTIQQVGALIKKIAPAGLLPSLVTADSSAVDNQLTPITSVVAVGIFEVDAPDFETQLSSFINWHLTQAHDAWAVPPGVNSIHRIGVTDSQDVGATDGKFTAEPTITHDAEMHDAEEVPAPRGRPRLVPAPRLQ